MGVFVPVDEFGRVLRQVIILFLWFWVLILRVELRMVLGLFIIEMTGLVEFGLVFGLVGLFVGCIGLLLWVSLFRVKILRLTVVTRR